MAEECLIQAKISDKISKKAFLITFCVFLILPVLLLFIGFATGKFHGDAWFGIVLDDGALSRENVVLLVVIMVLLSTVPFAIYFILNLLKRKLTALGVSETEVIASRRTFIPVAKISLRIPIDKIASIRKIKSFLFLYTGDVVCVSTASSTFRIPFVLNADEIIDFLSSAMNRGKGGASVPAEELSEK